MRNIVSNNIYQLSSTSSVQNSDLFVVSQQNRYVHDKFDSCAVNGSTVLNMLAQKVIALQDFGSAAYMQSSDFSPYNHNHDSLYNNLTLDLEYASQRTIDNVEISRNLSSNMLFRNIIDNSNALSIGNIFMNGTLIPVEVPLSSISMTRKISFIAIEPAVGSLKFVAKYSIDNNSSINYRSDSFDGWLYPDGSTFELKDFMLSNEIARLYRSSDTTFTLPDFRKFIKMNGTNQKVGKKSSAIGVVEKKNVLKAHSHETNMQCDISATFILNAVGNPEMSLKHGTTHGTVHCGNGLIKLKKSSMSFLWISNNGDASSLPFNSIIPKVLKFGTEYGIDSNDDYDIKTFDLAQKLFLAIDSYNNTNLCEQFILCNTLNLNPVDTIAISASMTNFNDIYVDNAQNTADETYPTHVILPIMIYVGQRKRNFI